MKETELVERMAEQSVIANLFFLAEQIMPYTTRMIAESWYNGTLTTADAEIALSYAVFG
jgi:hypothetical protein